MSSGEENQNKQNGNYHSRNDVRSEVLELNQKRNKIEDELKEYQQILQSQGVGMDDPLVDSEGFPRSDIDIYLVRQARNKITCLNNDIRSIMRQIEEKLPDYFDAQ